MATLLSSHRTARAPLWLCAALAVLQFLSAAGWAASEYEVKAAYLVNFAKLADWPPAAFGGKAKLLLGIVGRGAGADEIARIAAGASANGRAIEVRRFSAGDGAALGECHLLFVLEGDRADAVLAAVQGRPVLTVGESEEFARKGGAIGFVNDGGTVKFVANPKAAARHGVTVSAKLLRVARSVVN